MTAHSANPGVLHSAADRSAPAHRSRDRTEFRGGGPGRLTPRFSPWLFLAPYFIITAVFFLYPLIYATILSFYQTNGAKSRAFVGMQNFLFVLHDADFWRALKNTSVFTLCSICLQLPLSLGLALLLNARRDRLKTFFRLAIFSPNLVGQAFVGIMFQMFFIPRYGLFNIALQKLVGWGLEQNWLGDPSLVMPAIVITSLWLYVGFNMIYFLAALQSIDQSLIEAARIDGAGPFHLFLNVTVPAIAPVATFVVVTSTIYSFQLFELPYVLLNVNGNGGYGPKGSGQTVVGYLYQWAFENGDLGTAAAVGWLLALIIIGVSLMQIRLTGTLRNDA
jgi:ABC-type sugar transport system permease subunit